MKKIVRLTESELVRLVKRIISEQPGHERNVFHPKPGWTSDLSRLSGGVLKWDEIGKKYVGTGKDGTYHFYAPKNNKGQFKKVGLGQNTIGEYVIDSNSKEPFVGIKIVTQQNVQPARGKRFV